MRRERIKIRSQKGNIYYRWADITHWIGNNGRQFTTACAGRITYHVVGRDFDGAIFAARGH